MKNSGLALVPILIVGAVVVVVAGLGYTQIIKNNHTIAPSYIEPSHEQPSQSQSKNQQNPSAFYNKDGLYLTHTWPGAEHFSNEETEVLIFNESESSVEVKSFDLTYAVEGKVYPHKSGTWEKFPSKDNHEKIEYINISAQHYKGESLILEPGQQGKLHWHIQFGSEPLDGKQSVTVKLTLLKDGQTINIDEEFTRDSEAVFSKDEH